MVSFFNRLSPEEKVLIDGAERAEARVAELKADLDRALAARDRAADQVKALDRRMAQLSHDAGAARGALMRDLAAELLEGARKVTPREFRERLDAIERVDLAIGGLALADGPYDRAKRAEYDAQAAVGAVEGPLDRARTVASAYQHGVQRDTAAAARAEAHAQRVAAGLDS